MILEKNHTRQMLQSLRKQLNKDYRTQAAASVAAKIIHLPEFLNSQHIAYYLSHNGELDPTPIINCAIHLEKNLYLPILHPKKNKTLAFYSYKPHDTLIKNIYGILEPDPTKQKEIALTDLDIIFLPIVAFDEKCNRIGRGAGYYDRTLAPINSHSVNKKPLLIGLAYELQKINDINPSVWDVPMDMIVTEKSIFRSS